MADNKTRSWFKVVPMMALNGSSTKKAVIHINDAIGWDLFFGGVNAADLIAEIDALNVDELYVRINSEGGAAFDGLAIANALLRNPAQVTTYIDGLAASAASIVALAGDTVVMSKYGQMMIHNASAGVMGTADDMRAAAKFLDGLNGSMAQFYADRAGGDAKDWGKAMAAETWYTADAALAAGLVTEVDESAKRDDTLAAVAAAMARPTARFKHPATAAGTTGALASVTTTETQEGTVPQLSEKVAERLGLAADATDDDVLAKLDELSTPAESDAVEPDLATAVAKVQSAGQAVIDAETLARLQQQAADGAQALASITAAAHAKVVDDAIGQGKILPTQRGQYIALMESNADVTTKLLADTPVSAKVPVVEMGHALEAQASSDLSWFDSAPTKPANNEE